MSISSSLNAGVAGLATNAVKLAAIADNISNSETIGYKRAVAEFQSLVIDSGPNAYSAGGVRATPYIDVDDQGSLIGTGNATDLAIAGRGLLPVTNQDGAQAVTAERQLLLTATGSFTPDEDGYLRTTSGLFLLGFPADSNGDIGTVSRQSTESLEPVRVNVSNFTATPTENVGLGINLPAAATEAGATTGAYEITTEYFDNFGRAQVLRVEFTPQPPVSGAPTNNWTAEIFDNASGSEVSIGTFDVTFRDDPVNGGAIESINASSATDPTTSITTTGVYDSTTGTLPVTVESGTQVNIFIGRPNDNAGLTQLAADFSPYSLTKDGAEIGNLLDFEVDGQGNLDAVFDTGFRRTLYKIPVADVPNLNGLEAANASAYKVSQSSGDLYLWDAGDGPTGEMAGFSLMESTVDVANELTQLIQTQRAYSSNAKIIQTVDEILQETNSLVR
ncbi:putative flagellar hook protein [Parvularcula bermudensis HTCC2503]|uniref:Flagellar hook protein FlgE n=1 Tax=Parvularcula bermudensis (strain ATCC BAA-594 / HTCC2503 / KCTC 12087) TaxID=314260 RepID=E0TGK2_PARBH|nr:flagellar hook-basal body complex protein [Parvularcula bermudensis]ADM09621.1 putative flagellar hook protein [Parvularcula bermudensis HTCC2503]